VLNPGTCGGVAAKLQVLVSPPNPADPVLFDALVSNSLIGGNLSSIVVCKNDEVVSAAISNAGTNVRIQLSIEGDDPLVRGR
jgi:hypothetical protein